MIKVGFFAFPFILLVVMQIFSINYAMKYAFFSLVISLEALLFAFYIFV